MTLTQVLIPEPLCLSATDGIRFQMWRGKWFSRTRSGNSRGVGLIWMRHRLASNIKSSFNVKSNWGLKAVRCSAQVELWTPIHRNCKLKSERKILMTFHKQISNGLRISDLLYLGIFILKAVHLFQVFCMATTKAWHTKQAGYISDDFSKLLDGIQRLVPVGLQRKIQLSYK